MTGEKSRALKYADMLIDQVRNQPATWRGGAPVTKDSLLDVMWRLRTYIQAIEENHDR